MSQTGARLGPLSNPKPGKKGKVKAGTFMGVYTGELIGIKEARRREKSGFVRLRLSLERFQMLTLVLLPCVHQTLRPT